MAKKERDTEVKITSEQGQTLLRIASVFGLPKKLGDNNYTPMDQSLADSEVLELYRELKSRSPLLQKGTTCFGPMDNWELIESGEGDGRYKMVDPKKETRIKLDDNALSGAYWCVLLALHPGSTVRVNIGSQEDVVWPLAERLRVSGMIKKDLGLDKAKHKRLDLDPVEEEKK